MVLTYLSSFFDRLPHAEVVRLQKCLSLLIRNTQNRPSLKKSLTKIYKEKLSSMTEIPQVLVKLMENFGMISKADLSETEKSELQKSPFVMWPDENVCVLCREFFDTLAETFKYKKLNYFLLHLVTLPNAEKRSLGRWLGLNETSASQLTESIYLSVASKRLSLYELPTPTFRYLHEIFPNDIQNNSVAWFYKGVLPLYEAMRRASLADTTTDSQRKILELFRLGYLVVERETQAFGQPVTYRIVETRERKSNVTPSQSPAWPSQELRQESLLF